MRVIFMGKSKDSSYRSLLHLLNNGIEVPYAVIPEGESKLKKLCLENNIELVSDIALYEMIEKDDESLKEIDLVISFLFWKRIRKDIIKLGKRGCINFHPAPLPEYRGVGGYNFAILDELDYWGVSAHYVDKTIDTGEIIKVNKFEIKKDVIDAISLESISQSELL